ncbi:MAG: hypothetical protein KJ556_20040 [Gammaproteobacteria bacterium]|nr:hypothetical protein [Gammaproteobacteria bacterium]
MSEKIGIGNDEVWQIPPMDNFLLDDMDDWMFISEKKRVTTCPFEEHRWASLSRWTTCDICVVMFPKTFYFAGHCPCDVYSVSEVIKRARIVLGFYSYNLWEED